MIDWIDAGVTAPEGFLAGGLNCGIKKKKRDLAIVFSETPCVAAAVFTTNAVQAAPVVVSKRAMGSPTIRAVVVSSGNANCCTGQRGVDDARAMAAQCAEALEVSPAEVLVASTGPIGRYLPMEAVRTGITTLARQLSREGRHQAAEAILTTDLVTKEAAARLSIDGARVTLGAMAKGSGMIEPNMATMLAFITTDAVVERGFLQAALRTAVGRSFNRITVDGDRSTNDSVIALANGRAANPSINGGARGVVFEDALTAMCLRLAKMIVRDGEGATKLIAVTVRGAPDEASAEQAARAVANSPLVKTAMFGRSPNWGRVVAAVGASGVALGDAGVDVTVSGVALARGSAPVEFDEATARKALAADEIVIEVNLNGGTASATVWTCDLSPGYIEINV